jgi:hypothetical protein
LLAAVAGLLLLLAYVAGWLLLLAGWLLLLAGCCCWMLLAAAADVGLLSWGLLRTPAVAYRCCRLMWLVVLLGKEASYPKGACQSPLPWTPVLLPTSQFPPLQPP